MAEMAPDWLLGCDVTVEMSADWLSDSGCALKSPTQTLQHRRNKVYKFLETDDLTPMLTKKKKGSSQYLWSRCEVLTRCTVPLLQVAEADAARSSTVRL